eukprot:TRINITY_DN3856_c0_g1_i1.p1 TRINITY_DN3856_c0_g1~~TRINITY_DN3856_c0_g1_i1.p1  ORF type:complete len:251 (+),score=47.82 TRINITY_DN3856_c0_g1_i1:242-994(+)
MADQASSMPRVQSAGRPSHVAASPDAAAITAADTRRGASHSPERTYETLLDPSRPMVRSNKAPTVPRPPRFVDESLAEERRQDKLERILENEERKRRIEAARANERRFLKAQFEFERERRLAQQVIYQRERMLEQKARLATSPFLVDLAADHERITEDAAARRREEKRRAARQQRARQTFRAEALVNALHEAPLVDHVRKQKRTAMVESKRQAARERVAQAEVVAERVRRDKISAQRQRQLKMEQAAMDR